MPITLSHKDIHIIRILASVSGSLSCAGSALLILSYFLFTELRTFSSRLILALSISDLGESLAWALAPAADDNKFSCYLEGVGVQFFGVSSVLWQICISTYIVQVSLGHKHLERQEKYYHLICWGVPSVLAIAAGAEGFYGNSGAWCWIKHPHELPGLFLLYLPFMISVPYCILIYSYVHYILGRKEKSDLSTEEKISLQRVRNKLRSRYYLVPYAISWAFGLINRANNAAGPDRIAALYMLQAGLFPLQGFWNFLMYGYTERIVGPQDIFEVLSGAIPLQYFRQFLESTHAKEALDCCQMINRMKKEHETGGDWETLAKQVYSEFVAPSAPNEVNISGETKDNLAKGLTMPGFLQVQLEVIELMNQNMLNFKNSKFYADMVEELQAVEAIGGNSAGRNLMVSLYHKLQTIFCPTKADSNFEGLHSSSSA